METATHSDSKETRIRYSFELKDGSRVQILRKVVEGQEDAFTIFRTTYDRRRGYPSEAVELYATRERAREVFAQARREEKR